LAAGDEKETGTGSWNMLQKRQESVTGGRNAKNYT
jgi:hypothetical protein